MNPPPSKPSSPATPPKQAATKPGSAAAAKPAAKKTADAKDKTPAKPTLTKAPAKKPGFSLGNMWLLRDVAPSQRMIINEKVEIAKYKRLVSLVRVQALVIGMLACIIILGAPAVQVIYKYHASNPHHEIRDLVPLTGPNLTNDAVLSWATKSIVEILTLGFGDFDRQILSQYSRFTSEGWASFTTAIRNLDLRTTFKNRQLVLTTVPRDAAVIVGQGENLDQDYEWYIELPIIMTYTTNNNVTQKSRNLARLTLVRVPASQNSAGIAIKQWSLN